MKKIITFNVCLFMLFGLASVGYCQNPVTRIVAPGSISTFLEGTSIVISASASDNGSIAKVEFYQGAVKLGEDNTSPYQYTWAGATAGTYQLTSRAFDNEGNTTTSSVVNIIFHPVNFVSGKKYYVKEGASTGNNGLSPSSPFPTIQRAADLVNPGDSVFVMDGTYANTGSSGAVANIQRTGSPTNWIVFKNYPGHKPLLSFNTWSGFGITNGAAYIVIDGFKIQGNNRNIKVDDALNQPGSCNNPGGSVNPIYSGSGISLEGRVEESKSAAHIHHITIRNCEILECGTAGIAGLQADYVVIENNLVYNNAWYSVYGGSGVSLLNSSNFDNNTGYRNIIRNNVCHGNRLFVPWAGPCKITDGNGIIIDTNNNDDFPSMGEHKGRTLVTNNLVYNNGGSGIHSYKSNYVDIINNTAYQNSQSVETSGEIFANTSRDVNIMNNIIVPIKDERANSTSGSNVNVVHNYNLYFNTTKYAKGANDIVADPQFVNPSTNPVWADFRLLSTSPAIDKGTTTLAPAIDILGIARPYGAAIDMGAYEYDPTIPLPTEIEIIVFNVISPNGDGQNDVLQINGLQTLGDYSIRIFTKNGQVVFETTDYSLPWDGRNKGQDLPNGVYYYVVQSSSLTKQKTGYITLVK